jgi:exodeoxyribonuclease VII small subunit
MSSEPENASAQEWSFEAAMDRLNDIVAKIEGDSLELDESLALFEEGVRLLRFAEEVLDGAEERIRQLVESGEQVRLEPLPGEL